MSDEHKDRVSNAEVRDATNKPSDQHNRHGGTADQLDIGSTDAEDKGAISNPTPDEDRVSDATPDVGSTDTFPREYVEELRGENATYRNRAKDAEAKADELAQALWTERVRSLGVLADPADLPYDPEALDDLEQIKAKADELLSSKPHLRTRKITERAGQGERGAETVSLVELLQRGA